MDSLKKYLVCNLSTLPELPKSDVDIGNASLVILTAAGRITGHLITDPCDDKGVRFANALVSNIIRNYREEHSLSDESLDGNDGCITLCDVTVDNGSSVFHSNFLVVFFDQIIAVTVGESNG